MNLKQRIWLLPALAALVFLVGATGVAWMTARTSSTIQRLGSTEYPYLDGVTTFAAQLETMVSTVQSAVAEGDKDRLSEVAERSASMRKLLGRIQAIEGKGEAAALLESRFDAYAQAAMDAAAILLKARQGDQAAAVAAMQTAQKALAGVLEAEREAATHGMNEGIGNARRGVAAALTAMIACAVLVVGGLGIGSALLVRNVWREIGGEPAYARRLLQRMACGDLSVPVTVPDDAPGSLLAALREMSTGLAGIVQSVRHGTDSITVASAEIAHGNADLSTRTEQTAGSLQQTASSIEQLTGTVRQTAQSAQTANQLAASAAAVARRGGEAVAQVVATMHDIDGAAKRIGDIIGTIDGIAFQTNILALNAAVEAARAGEHGRGFAVVAAEVRSLAGRSAAAAREIKSLVAASVAKAGSGTALVADAGTTMTEIVASVQRVTDIMGEISAACAEQSQGIGTVNQAVGQLDRMTQQNAALVEQSAAAAESLRDQASRLAGAVGTFQLASAA